MAYRPEFTNALKLLADATRMLGSQGLPAPVLVGGGAVELYSAGNVMSGDFDLVTPHQTSTENALIALGFLRPAGSGKLLRGLIHPGRKRRDRGHSARRPHCRQGRSGNFGTHRKRSRAQEAGLFHLPVRKRHGIL